MRILDENGAVLDSPNLETGYLLPEKRLIAHHPAQPGTEEVGHYEVTAEYPNGGKDVQWIVDIPGVPAKDAWDEYEDILRFIPYSPEELAERAQPSPQADTDALLIDHELRLTLLELGTEG